MADRRLMAPIGSSRSNRSNSRKSRSFGPRKTGPSYCWFLRGYMEGIHCLKSHKDESLTIFSKYVRNPDLGVMAHVYDEMSARAESGLRPQAEAVRAPLDLAALDLPQAKKLSENDHWDLSRIDEIQKSGFLEQLGRR